MNHVVTKLPVLVLNVQTRCNCRCGMCDIWKNTDEREMSASFVNEHLDEFEELGVRWVVLTGGEPLMHTRLFSICDSVHSRGIRVTVLTSGLLVSRCATEIARSVDDLIISLDGPPAIHDAIRGVTGAFDSIRRGVSALRKIRPGYRVAARCTVQCANHAHLLETVEAAAAIGIDSLSFLAVDVFSPAFNRSLVWPDHRRNSLVLSAEQIGVLDDQLLRVQTHPIVADSGDHLRRLVNRFRAYSGIVPHEAPPCNAPWTSAVIEVDGTLRPCFFHAPLTSVDGGFRAALNGSAAIAFRSALDVAENETCKRCVCSLFHK